MGLDYDQIDDAVLLTQKMLVKKGAFIDMQTDITNHVAVREMWKRRVKKFMAGQDWTWSIQMDHNHSAKVVGLYETDSSALKDTMVLAKAGVRHINAHYVYDQREPDFQRGGTAIVDLVQTRYTGMMVSLYELMETILWSKPESSADTKTPYGIAYWVTRSATEGFNGGNPAGFADGRAGISTTTYPRWANWTAQYANISDTDLIRKMRTASRKTQFRSPVSHANPGSGDTANGIYSNNNVIGLMEEVLQKNNMALGNDLAPKDGRVVFKGTPMTYAPKLDDDSTDPIYMLDWSQLFIGVLEGWENNLSKPEPVPNMHLVRRVDLDASMNMVCYDLRKQAVFAKAA